MMHDACPRPEKIGIVLNPCSGTLRRALARFHLLARNVPGATVLEATTPGEIAHAVRHFQLKESDLLVIATDVNAAYIDFGKPTQKSISYAHPDEMEKLGFAAGSMGPKVQAACEFARHTG